MARLSMLSLVAAIVAPSPSFAQDKLSHCFDVTGGGSGNDTHHLKVVLSNALKSHTCARAPDVVTLENMLERCSSFCDPKGIPILIGTDSSGFNQQEMDEICTGGTADDAEFNGLIHDPDLIADCNGWSGALRKIKYRMVDFIAAERVFGFALMDFQSKLYAKIQEVQIEMQKPKVAEEVDLAGIDEKGTVFKDILRASLKDIMKTGLLNRDLTGQLNTLETKAEMVEKTMEAELSNLINFADKCNEFILGTGKSKEYLLDICSVTSDKCIEDAQAKHSGCCCGIVPAAGVDYIAQADYRRLETDNNVDICASAYERSQQSVDQMMSSLRQSTRGETILNNYQASMKQQYTDFYSDCDSRRLREMQGTSSGIDVGGGSEPLRQLSQGPKYLTCSPPRSHSKPDQVTEELRVNFIPNVTESALCKDLPYFTTDENKMADTCARFCGDDAVPLLLGSTAYGLNQEAMDEVCLSPDTSGAMYSEDSVRTCHSRAQAFRDLKYKSANIISKLKILEDEQLLFEATSRTAVSNLREEIQTRGAKTIDDTKASERLDEIRKLLRAALGDILDTDSQVRRRLRIAAQDVKEAADLFSKSMKTALPQLRNFMEQCNVMYTGVGPGREYLLDFCSASSKECIESDESAHAGCCCGYNPITSLGKARTETTIPGSSVLRRLRNTGADSNDINICAKAYQDSKLKRSEIETKVKKIDRQAWESNVQNQKAQFPAYYARCARNTATLGSGAGPSPSPSPSESPNPVNFAKMGSVWTASFSIVAFTVLTF